VALEVALVRLQERPRPDDLVKEGILEEEDVVKED